MCQIRHAVLLAAGLAVLLAGCGGKRLYPVEGVVKFEDGSAAQELAGGTVSLESVADRSNPAGEIRPDGTFRLRGPMGEDGVAAGAYRALVLPPPSADRKNPPIDPVLGRYETAGIEVTVKEEKNTITVVVRRPAARRVSPAAGRGSGSSGVVLFYQVCVSSPYGTPSCVLVIVGRVRPGSR
jgi:hypothetical protein